MKLPILYKKTSTGAIQFWEIETGEYDNIAWIETVYGQLGTDSPQHTTDYVDKGKNIGKKNETTPLQQAEAEALAKWTKQVKKGYIESIELAKIGEVDELIQGGIVPMLAHKYSDHGHKIKYLAYIQPKLDGIRCIAILRNGKCTLWSRTRKQITSMPHIVKEIESMRIDGELILDGELYNQDFKNNFEHIVSLVRQEEPDPRHTDVQYHVYDIAHDTMTFEHRFGWLQDTWKHINDGVPKHLQLVNTILTNEEGVAIHYKLFKSLGYEGAILRNADGKYVNKRSYDLQKVKEFDDGEFEIIGVEEGRGKLQGHVGAFICRTADGKEFLAKMSGDTGKLKEYFENHSLWKNKKLTVQYQGLTGKEGVPRFPVGISIRDYE